MYLFKQAQYQQLIKNGTEPHQNKDHIPVAKIILPDGVWLLIELDSRSRDTAFGLKISEGSFPVFAHIELIDIFDSITDRNNPPIEYDFTSKFAISIYESAARFHKCFIDDEKILIRFAEELAKGQLNLFC